MSDNPLSNLQKAVLSQIAKKAYEVAGRHFATDDLTSEDWRHREAITACGSRISQARNSQYNALKSHFENLAGAAGRAFSTAMREPTERRRQLLWSLDQSLKKYGLDQAYVDALATGPRFKSATLSALTDDQLLQLLMTVNNRGRGKCVAEAPQAPCNDPA